MHPTKKLTHLSLIALFAATACHNPHNHDNQAGIKYNENDFHEGDLILRHGRGIESHFVGAASRGDFSHIGILHHDSIQGWMVIHAVPGETPPHQTDVVKEEPVKTFFQPERATLGGVAHVNCDSTKKAQAVAYALTKAKQQVPFDHDYRLSDTTTLYCTELVWMSYRAQGIDLTEGQRSHLPAITTDTEYILPTDIIENKHVGTVTIYKPAQ